MIFTVPAGMLATAVTVRAKRNGATNRQAATQATIVTSLFLICEIAFFATIGGAAFSYLTGD